MEGKYLEAKDLLAGVPHFPIGVEDLGQTDTYHEKKILDKVLQYNKEDLHNVIKAAIQISIIGSGQRSYGFIRDKDRIIQLKDLFNKLNIGFGNNQDAKLAEDEITARRLVRLFRYQIQRFIMETGRPSYLWFKYSDKNPQMKQWCFPGAEHLVETREQCLYLLGTYGKLDKEKNSRFCLRLQRVFISRGIMMPEDF